jgi:hypothetical protein
MTAPHPLLHLPGTHIYDVKPQDFRYALVVVRTYRVLEVDDEEQQRFLTTFAAQVELRCRLFGQPHFVLTIAAHLLVLGQEGVTGGVRGVGQNGNCVSVSLHAVSTIHGMAMATLILPDGFLGSQSFGIVNSREVCTGEKASAVSSRSSLHV